MRRLTTLVITATLALALSMVADAGPKGPGPKKGPKAKNGPKGPGPKGPKAQNGPNGPKGPKHRHRPHGPRHRHLMKRFDKNKNGKLEPAERAALRAFLRKHHKGQGPKGPGKGPKKGPKGPKKGPKGGGGNGGGGQGDTP